MEIREGYKQTEVGVIPISWNIRSLESITTRIGDGLHGTPVYSVNGGYYFINGNNLRNGKMIATDDTKSVDSSEFKKHEKPLGNKTILLSINGTIGNLALLDDEKIVLGKSAAYLNAKNKTSKFYIYYSLQTPNVKLQFFDGMTGSTIGNLGLTTIRGTQIPIPSDIAEQKAIATALSDMDALLEGLDQLIAKKRDIKQATMQQLLTGKTRLAGFEGEWEMHYLDELAKMIISGKSRHSNEVGSYPVYGSTGVIGYTETPEYEGKSILIARVGANAGILNIASGFYGVSDNTLIVQLHSNNSFIFIWYLLKIKNLNSLVFGSGQPLITGSQIKSLPLIMPLLSEQTAIANILSDIDTEIEALEKRRAKTLSLKQAMIQELLTGKTRLI